MVCLISSRLHRCYNPRGVQKSAKIEKITTGIHVIACVAILLCRDFSFISSPPPLITAPAIRIAACFLLIIIHMTDLYATIMAHRKFYRWTKAYKRPTGFISTPTKVDALTVSAYLCATLTLFASATGLIGKPWVSGNMPVNINTFYCLFSTIAAFTNLILSLPSLDFNIPSALARMHNFIVAIFCISCAVKLQCSIIPILAEPTHDLVKELAKIAFFADVMILVASIINVVRVPRFLTKTAYWVTEDTKGDTDHTKGGLLSWFKPSQTTVDASDLDSDDLDDYDAEYDDEEWNSKSSRRNAV